MTPLLASTAAHPDAPIAAWLLVLADISLCVAGLTAAWIAWSVLTKRRQMMVVMKWVWPVTALYMGPLALFAYRRFQVAPTAAGRKKPLWTQVFTGVTHCGAGCTLGDIVAEFAVFAAGAALLGVTLYAEFVADYVLAYALGIVFQYFAIAPMRGIGGWEGKRPPRRAASSRSTSTPAAGRTSVDATQSSRRQGQLPGLRPCGFHSPFEAAAWCVLSQRIRIVQAARVRDDLIRRHGEDGAFPSPEVLRGLGLDLPGRKPEYLHAVAEAALEGRLDGATLRSVEPDEAIRRVQEVKGLGPFAAELVVIRGANAPDALPRHEARLDAEVVERYGATRALTEISETWRPFRSWAVVHLRALREQRTHEIGEGRSRPSGSLG